MPVKNNGPGMTGRSSMMKKSKIEPEYEPLYNPSDGYVLYSQLNIVAECVGHNF